MLPDIYYITTFAFESSFCLRITSRDRTCNSMYCTTSGRRDEIFSPFSVSQSVIIGGAAGWAAGDWIQNNRHFLFLKKIGMRYPINFLIRKLPPAAAPGGPCSKWVFFVQPTKFVTPCVTFFGDWNTRYVQCRIDEIVGYPFTHCMYRHTSNPYYCTSY